MLSCVSTKLSLQKVYTKTMARSTENNLSTTFAFLIKFIIVVFSLSFLLLYFYGTRMERYRLEITNYLLHILFSMLPRKKFTTKAHTLGTTSHSGYIFNTQ